MVEAALLTEGDEIERSEWPALRRFFPSYESLWRRHVYPLRCQGSIYFRRGIDERFEQMAMNHYTTFVNLARARQKIETKVDDLKFWEEIYANLQRAAEVAVKTVEVFREICQECLGKRSAINTTGLAQVQESLRRYRNFLHDPVLATLKDEHAVRLIPRRDKLENYRLSTTVMYERDPRDFVPVDKQLWDDFLSLCSALQSVWKEMEEASTALVQNTRYVKLRDAGQPSVGFSTAVPLSVSGTIIKTSQPK
jgi:hypothetical protein